MKIKGVDFPEPLLNALRDGRLVVFAGAGVSMGPPAGLPSFRKLAERVTEGISESITESEAVDQFLGRLEGYKGKESYQLATKLLHSSNPAPSPVYRNLLHLFHTTCPDRIITTDFECLLGQEAGAEGAPKAKSTPLQCPDLWLGSCFQGTVHKSNITWNKADRSKDMESAPWSGGLSSYHLNDRHMIWAKKRSAREAVG